MADQCEAAGYDDLDREALDNGHKVSPWRCEKPPGHNGDHALLNDYPVRGEMAWSTPPGPDPIRRVAFELRRLADALERGE